MADPRITPALIAPYYMKKNPLYNITKHLPSRSLLMVQWVYETHNEFLEDYLDFWYDTDGTGIFGWPGEPEYENREARRTALNKQKATNAKELKAMFPEIKHYNDFYSLIIRILVPVIRDDTE